MLSSIDLNCDLGEGMANDPLIMPFISSVNIACGYHAGDSATMKQTLELAMQYSVAAGAHPSFPDRENFGRTEMYLPPQQIYDLVKDQVETLANMAVKYNYPLHHVKPHGALYNMAAKDEELSTSVCKAILDLDSNLIVYAPATSKLASVATSMHLKTCHEVFADRSYRSDGSLVPRSQPNALIDNEEAMSKQLLQILTQQSLTAEDGKTIPVKADTICLHGDGEQALEFARLINELLYLNHIALKPMG